MTDKQKAKCNGIIHGASAASAGVGAGLAPVPGSDNLLITPIQLTMTISLGEVFGITIDQSAAKAALSSAAASTVGRAVSQVLIGWFPGIGNAINAATAFTLTESLGWVIAKDFDRQTAS